MSNTVSIAEAKAQLPKLVHEAEAGQPVELTRRGRPVAIILSIQEYRRLSADRTAFWDNLEAFRKEHNLTEAGIEPEEWLGDARQTAEPRDFGRVPPFPLQDCTLRHEGCYPPA